MAHTVRVSVELTEREVDLIQDVIREYTAALGRTVDSALRSDLAGIVAQLRSAAEQLNEEVTCVS